MGKTILLIDDSAILRRIATNVLGSQAARYEVVTATRATEGFARACGTQASLILVDAQLAGTAKAELCQRFLDEPRTAAVPVVLLMGQGAQTPRFEDLPENIVDTLSKPFTPEQLIASVKAILGATKQDARFSAIRDRVRGERRHGEADLVDRQAVTAAARSEVKTSPTAVTDADRPLAQPADTRRGGRSEPADWTRAERPLTVMGHLRATLHGIAAEKLSGALSISLPGRPALEIYFDAGKLVVVTTRDAAAYGRGAAEALPAKFSPATLEAVFDEQRLSGVPIFLTLGARGLLSKATAVRLIHQFGQQCFARLWELRSAHLHCEFTPMEALPGFALRLEPRRESIDEWLLSTLRCLTTEDVAATARYEGFVGTPSFLRNGQTLLNFLELNPQEKDFARRVNGRNDLPGIAKAMGLTAEDAYLVLCRFRALEVMDYRPAPAAYVVTPRTSVRRVLPLRR